MEKSNYLLTVILKGILSMKKCDYVQQFNKKKKKQTYRISLFEFWYWQWI